MNYQNLNELIKKYPHLIIVLVGVFVRLPLLFSPLTSYGTDAWRQADTASIAYHFYVNGYRILYPQIFWGGSGPGYVETEFQLYPFIVSILFYFLGENYWLGRLVSLLFSVLTWVLFYSLAQKILGKTSAALGALFVLVFSPLYLRYSVAFMPEATVMFFYVAALLSYVTWISTSKPAILIISSIFTALAILVKPTSVNIGLIFLLLGLEKWGVGIVKRKEVWVSLAIALIPGMLWYWHARGLFLNYGNTFGLLSGGDSKFGNLDIWSSPRFYLSIVNLDTKWILGYGAILPFIAGMIHAVKKKEFSFIVFGVAIVGLYYMIVARYSREEWGIQYHVYMLPYAALAIGLGVGWIIDRYDNALQKSGFWFSTGIFVCVASILVYRMLFTYNVGFMQCASYVKELVPKNDRIVVSTTSVALDNGIPNNYQEPDIFFYSRRYGWSLPADKHTADELISFRKLGAAYFVIYSNDLLNKNQALTNYLAGNALQLGPGIDSGCAIYRLDK